MCRLRCISNHRAYPFVWVHYHPRANELCQRRGSNGVKETSGRLENASGVRRVRRQTRGKTKALTQCIGVPLMHDALSSSVCVAFAARRGTHEDTTIRLGFGGCRGTRWTVRARSRCCNNICVPTAIAFLERVRERERKLSRNYHYRSFASRFIAHRRSVVIHCSFAAARSERYIIASARAKRFIITRRHGLFPGDRSDKAREIEVTST